MSEWAMAHPWMTFFLVVLLLVTIDGFTVNVINTVRMRKK